ncbi:hypothetical protein [Streptomyces sp. NPDC060065]|uniref:hypothetical protein n=1 Tax=Streptomyces sp. NPDC060065 TaxID=3347050 RepID=UPI00368E4D58
MQLHRRLTAEHFVDGRLPSLSKLRRQLAGEGLSWDLAEAVADVCHPDDDSEMTVRRLARPQELWRLAQTAPTATDGSGPQVTAREVLEAQRQAITAYEELNRARRAFEASEQGRLQALQIATILFGMLGQAQAKVLELTRRIDALRSSERDPGGVASLEANRRRAQSQEVELRTQLTRADGDRQRAQAVADHAARRMQELEAELAALRAKHGTAARSDGEHDSLLPAPLTPPAPEEAGLDVVDAVLQKARVALDREHDAVQEAGEDLGLSVAVRVSRGGGGGRSAPGAAATLGAERMRGTAQEGGTLLATILHNSVTTNFVPGELASGIESSLDRMRFASAATERIAAGTSVEEVITGLGDAAVPEFADGILIYLRDPLQDYESSSLSAVSLAHQRPKTLLAAGTRETERSGVFSCRRQSEAALPRSRGSACELRQSSCSAPHHGPPPVDQARDDAARPEGGSGDPQQLGPACSSDHAAGERALAQAVPGASGG